MPGCRVVRFVRCRLLRLSGVTGLAGAVIDRTDLLELADTLAATVGIRIAGGDDLGNDTGNGGARGIMAG